MNIARGFVAILAAAVILTAAAGGWAQEERLPGPVGTPQGFWRAQFHWIPMTDSAGNRHLLQSRICRPPSEAPARIVIIAHGTFPDNHGVVPLRCDAEAVRWFLDRGFVAVMALRRGYGATGGDWAEGIYHRPGDDYAVAGLKTAHDISATVDYAVRLPFARPQAAVVIGHSGGGWGTVAYNSLPHPHVTAMISMAGGRGQSKTKTGLSGIWRPDLLTDAAARFGRSATTPMLWVYAVNDRYIGPPIPAALYDAFTRTGGKADFEQTAPYDEDGHHLFFGKGGSLVWGPLVAAYLARQPAQ